MSVAFSGGVTPCFAAPSAPPPLKSTPAAPTNTKSPTSNFAEELQYPWSPLHVDDALDLWTPSSNNERADPVYIPSLEIYLNEIYLKLPLNYHTVAAARTVTSKTTPKVSNVVIVVRPNPLSHLLVEKALDLRTRNSNSGVTNAVYIESPKLDFHLQQPLGIHAVTTVPATPAAPTPPASKVPIVLPNPLSHLLIDGALDLRTRNSNSGRTNSIYIQSLEIDLQQPLDYHQVQQGSIFLQMIGENPPDVLHQNGIKQFAVGEAYVSYRLPIMTDTDSTAYVKIGQFALPVGLMATYDTHQEILQSLYPIAIGERTDWGAAVSGRFYGVLDYNFAITSGTGPGNFYSVPDRVVAFRLGRLFVTQYGTFNLGGSLLGGRLPVTEINPLTGFPPELAPSGKLDPVYGYEEKTRVIGDGQWTYRNITARGEAMYGYDTNNSAAGAFLENEYRFAPGLSAILADTYWNYGVNDSYTSDIATGINISYGRGIVIRTLYEFQRNVPETHSIANPDINRQIFTLQVLLRY